jgi:ribonuclease G
MNKELYVSSTPHETKVALVEDDQLAEVYFERENEHTLAGSIYKGRVTRVLPGMQSAFVDVGLERDAFLYVSDFLDFAGEEDEEEFGEVQVRPQFAEVKQSSAESAPAGPEAKEPEEEELSEEAEEPAEAAEAESADAESQDADGAHRWRGRRRRRGRRGGREREPESQPASSPAEATPGELQAAAAPEKVEPGIASVVQQEQSLPEARAVDKEPMNYQGMPADYAPIVLPGESIARYSRNAEAEPREARERPTETRQEYPSRRDEFRSRRGGRERGRDRDRGHEREREPREEYSLPENYTPMVLPGESISKYRKPESGTAMHPEVAPAEARHFDSNSDSDSDSELRGTPQPEAGGLPEPSRGSAASATAADTITPEVVPVSTSADYEVAPGTTGPQAGEPLADYAGLAEAELLAYRQPATPADRVLEEKPGAPVIVPLNDGEPFDNEAAPAAAPPALAPRLENEPATKVAAQEKPWEFRASADEPLATPSGDGEFLPTLLTNQEMTNQEIRPAGQQDAARDEPVATLPSDRASTEELFEAREGIAKGPQSGGYSPEGGPVVHEELDEEETDMPSYAEHFDTEVHQEMVEQVFDRLAATANGDLLGHVVRETGEEQVLDESEYDFDPEDADEFEESEILAEPEFAGEEAAEAAGQGLQLSDGGRAELRAPEATAGYQQRAGRTNPERGGRDRRGRRGRPMPTGARRETSRQVPLISDLLKEGQEVLIQIAKEPIGKKGARITSHIALPGRFLVYMPTVNHVGVSRKISSDDERQRLKRIVASERENGHGGFIVRTAAAGIKEDELRADIRFLKHLWNEIRSRADNSKSPALIYHDLNLVERILRDQVTQDFSQIWVDNEQEYERVVRFASRFQPNLVRRIKLYTKPTPLFEQFGIQEEINKSLKSKVWLKSGGYIVINQTEALVAIDINTGKYVGKTTRLEDTIVKTNCDAIKEIVRQIRLRDLGGIIVIDFIDMDERKNRQKVMQALEEALESDRAPSKVLQFNDFGLVAITRKRVKQSLERTLGSPCPYCSATGFVKSVTTVCNEIYSEMRKIRPHVQAADVTLRVNPEVAKELKSNNGRWLTEMEELVRRPILIKSDAPLHQEQFDIQF